MDDLAWHYDADAREGQRKAGAVLAAVFVMGMTLSLAIKVGPADAGIGLTVMVCIYGAFVTRSWRRQRTAQEASTQSGYRSWPAAIPAGYVPDARSRPRSRASRRVSPDVLLLGRFEVRTDDYRWVPSPAVAKSFGCRPLAWGRQWTMTRDAAFGFPPQSHVTLRGGDHVVDLWLWWASDLPVPVVEPA